SILVCVGGLYPVLWAMFKYSLMSAFTSRPPVLHMLRYADVLPDHRKAIDSIDAMLRGLGEYGGHA
ncbi:MAG: hypothetical protein ACPLRJ_06330, partial [Infirmifilum uzonense]|uniref:hypothetical protein n=1 Tax=Infirmifilum uzonense TaxID=1550241 RepID=UPI003C775BE1